MKLNGKKLFEFAERIGGCVVMGIVSSATQTLWYKIAEPKILNAMDKNTAKHPIGFRGGGVLMGSSLLFRRFFNLYYGEEVSSEVRAQPEMVDVIGSSPILLL